MKRISILALILCACCVSVAWGQKPAATCSNNWTEFHRPNMARWNPCERVLNVNNVGGLSVHWMGRFDDGASSPTVANGA